MKKIRALETPLLGCPKTSEKNYLQMVELKLMLILPVSYQKKNQTIKLIIDKNQKL